MEAKHWDCVSIEAKVSCVSLEAKVSTGTLPL